MLFLDHSPSQQQQLHPSSCSGQKLQHHPCLLSLSLPTSNPSQTLLVLPSAYIQNPSHHHLLPPRLQLSPRCSPSSILDPYSLFSTWRRANHLLKIYVRSYNSSAPDLTHSTTKAFNGYNVLCGPASGTSSDLLGSSPPHLLFSSATLTSLLFLKHDQTHYSSGPLHSLFPLPGTFFL